MTFGAPSSFTRVMHEHDDLTEDHPAARLRALGTAPVADDVRDDHLHAMRVATPAPPARAGFGRVAVAAAAVIGFAVGSTGFAMAGALPGPAQGVAHDVLSVIQVDVPDRPQNRGACVSAAAEAGDEAAKAACPKGKPDGVPGHANGKGKGEGKGNSDGKGADAPGRPAEAGPHPNADTSDCKGKPPWAAEKRKPTPEERADREACPPDEDDDAEIEEIEELDAQEQRREAPAATPAQPATPADPPADPQGARPDGAGAPDGAGRPDDAPPAG